MNIIKKARIFAENAHRGQVRKYTGEPYINHPITVANMVNENGGSSEMIAAALLHDVVEDTPHTIEDINVEFGLLVSALVGYLTDISKPADGNRAKRKAMDRAHIAAAPKEAKTIKLADMIDNTGSIVSRDPKFAKVYMAEKKALLEVLSDGNQELFDHANTLVADYYKTITTG